jgi:hypothetical protein
MASFMFRIFWWHLNDVVQKLTDFIVIQAILCEDVKGLTT